MSENLLSPDVLRGTSPDKNCHTPEIPHDLDPASPLICATDPPDALTFGPTYARHRASLIALLPKATRAYSQALALADGDDWQGRAVALRGATALEDRLFGPAGQAVATGLDAVAVEIVVGSSGPASPPLGVIEIEPEQPLPVVGAADSGRDYAPVLKDIKAL